MKKLIIAAALLLSGCFPARKSNGDYWAWWDVPHRVLAHRSDTRIAHQMECPPKP